MKIIRKIILLSLFVTLTIFAFKYKQHIPFFGKFFRITTSQMISKIESAVLSRFSQKNIDLTISDKTKLTVLIAKKEKTIYLFLSSPAPVLLTTYSMTAFSGELGPKNQEGDRQIPEGSYRIEGLNPNSLYYLSLKLNYPNQIDSKRAKLNKINSPGSNIFIHGKDVTIGCIPIGDSGIEEIFYLAHRIGKGNIDVLITPTININNFDFSIYAKNESDRKLLSEKYFHIKESLKKLPLNNQFCLKNSDCKIIYSSCFCKAVKNTDPRSVLNDCSDGTSDCSIAKCNANMCKHKGVKAICENRSCHLSDKYFEK